MSVLIDHSLSENLTIFLTIFNSNYLRICKISENLEVFVHIPFPISYNMI